MKFKFLFFVVASLLVAAATLLSCSSKDDEEETIDNNPLVGTWIQCDEDGDSDLYLDGLISYVFYNNRTGKCNIYEATYISFKYTYTGNNSEGILHLIAASEGDIKITFISHSPEIIRMESDEEYDEDIVYFKKVE